MKPNPLSNPQTPRRFNTLPVIALFTGVFLQCFAWLLIFELFRDMWTIDIDSAWYDTLVEISFRILHDPSFGQTLFFAAWAIHFPCLFHAIRTSTHKPGFLFTFGWNLNTSAVCAFAIASIFPTDPPQPIPYWWPFFCAAVPACFCLAFPIAALIGPIFPNHQSRKALWLQSALLAFTSIPIAVAIIHAFSMAWPYAPVHEILPKLLHVLFLNYTAFPIIAFAVNALALYLSRHRHRRLTQDSSLLCPACNYNLSGTPHTPTCPECGTPIPIPPRSPTS